MIVAVVVVGAALVTMNKLDSWQTVKGPDDEESSDMVYNIEGVDCYKKQNVETYLFMGLDRFEDTGDVVNGHNHSQSDTNVLVIFDRTKDTYTTLSIDRNTIVTVQLDNDDADMTEGSLQLALAFTMGDGKESSCEKVSESISNLLYGQRINGYIALDMSSIKIVNHILGGVTVTMDEDYTAIDPAMRKGATITLTDEQAQKFVRSRKGVAGGKNTNRIKRQNAYIDAATEQLRINMDADSDYVDKAVDQLEPYMITDMSNSEFSKLAKAVTTDKKEDPPKIEAYETINPTTHWVEAHYNDNSLAKAVIELYYKPVEPAEMIILDEE